jgi:hypothetical protein
MSTPHRRLFEASLAALLLADCHEEEFGATVPAPGQWHNSMCNNKIGEGTKSSAPAEEIG